MLDLHPLLMLIVLAIFFILLYQLNTRVYGPMIKFMDERDEAISRDLKEAGTLSGGNEELLAKAQENLDRAKSRAAQMRQEAIEKMKNDNIRLVEKKEAEQEKEYSEFLNRLAEEKESLKSSILSQLPLIKESLKAKFSQI